jgi:hypothetical protein
MDILFQVSFSFLCIFTTYLQTLKSNRRANHFLFQKIFYQICNITRTTFVKPRNHAMRKQPVTNVYFILFSLLALVVAFMFFTQPTPITDDATVLDCPKQINALEGTDLLWESLSHQFVRSSLFN